MDREDIIRMAREAGFEIDCCSLEWHDRIERFAALVRIDEREACATVCEEEICNCCWDDDAKAAAEHLAAAIRARGQA